MDRGPETSALNAEAKLRGPYFCALLVEATRTLMEWAANQGLEWDGGEPRRRWVGGPFGALS